MRNFIGDQFALFFFTLWILWTCFCIFNIILFFKNKNNLYIKCRVPSLSFCSSLGQYFIATSFTWKIILLPENYINFIDSWLVWVFIPLQMLPYIMRSLRFILKYKLQKYDSVDEAERKKHRFLSWCKKPKNVKYTTNKAFFIYTMILLFVFILVAVYRNIITSRYDIEYDENTKSIFTFCSCICLFILGNVFLWISIYLLRQTDEMLFITIELLIVVILWDIIMPLYVIFSWVGHFDFRIPSILFIFESMATFLISFGMPVQLSLVKKRDYISTVDKLNSLEGLLEDEQGKSLFLDFLTFNKDCKECLLFHQEVNEYMKITDFDDMKKKFKWIRKTYVQNDSPLHVNVSSKLIDKVMRVNPENPSQNSFQPIYQSNLMVLKTDAFREFKTSSEFKKYVNAYKALHFETENE